MIYFKAHSYQILLDNFQRLSTHCSLKPLGVKQSIALRPFVCLAMGLCSKSMNGYFNNN